jgi:putative sporulation protein YtaF
MIFTISLLAISLSLDALGVGLVYGMRRIKIPFYSKLVICFFSILYSGGSILLGRTLANFLSPFAAKLIGLSILILMGIWIILQALIKNSSETVKNDEAGLDSTLLTIVIKSLGITIQVVRNPVEFDFDRSGSIDASESLLLGLALSVDAIGVGIGSALVGFHSLGIPLCVGLTQLLLLYVGAYIGERFVSQLKINEKMLSILPGVLLICFALIRIY